jgi:uncharacterized membrane protein YukC
VVKRDDVGSTLAFITDPEHVDGLWDFLYEEFDEDAEAYSRQYISLQGQLKALKKYLFIKLICLPIELPAAYLLLGRLEAKIKIKTSKKIWEALKASHLTAEQMAKVYDLC